MNLHAIQFDYPGVLWLLLIAPPIVLLAQWRTRSGAGSLGRTLSTCVRIIALIIGILALAGPERRRTKPPSSEKSVIILRDCSDSVAEDTGASGVEGILTSSLASKVLVKTYRFASALVDDGQPPASTSQTNIERALDDLADQAPDLRRHDVILLSDGRGTQGAATAGATRIALRGARLHVIPIGRAHEQPPHLLDIQPPTDARLGVSSSMAVTVGSTAATNCAVTLLDPSGNPVETRTIPINADGRSTAILRFLPTKYGLNRYSVKVEQQGVATDSRAVPLYVESPPRLLLVDVFPDELVAMKSALESLKLPIDVIRPDALPDDLGPYAAVIMSDLSGKEFTTAQRTQLRQFVEQTGGGLVFIGGGNVVAADWNRNELADLLPVKLRPRPPKVVQKDPDISVCFVVDKSGSMSQVLPGSSAGVSKIELVKASIIASVQSLPDSAKVAVIAFDNQPSVVVPPTLVAQKEQISRLVDSIGVGGGTAIYPGIEQGIGLLDQMTGNKYLIVLTDGRSMPPPQGDSWDGIADIAAQHNIAWTSVAVGADADQKLLSSMANRHAGRFAYCGTGDQIPEVFVEETKAIKRVSQSVDKPFRPQAGPDVKDLHEFAREDLPILHGVVPADARSDTHVQLVTDNKNVLLSDWQFGAGRVVAFESDVKGAWAGEWLRWKDFDKFWTQVVSTAMRIRPPLRARVRSSRSGDHVQYTFQVTDEDGRPSANLECSASLDPAPPKSVNVQWRRLQPGVYRADLDLPSDEKTYDIAMTLRRDDRRSIQYHASVTGASNAEMAFTGPDVQACNEIAFAGDGVCDTNPAAIVQAVLDRPDDPPVVLMQPLWPILLVAMLLLWPVDVWVRKML